MRASNLILGLVAAGAMTGLGLAGCGDDSGGDPTGGNPGGNPGGSGDNPCAPENDSACNIAREVESECISLVDNSKSSKFTLRIAQLEITAPSALSDNPTLSNVIGAGVRMNLPECLKGTTDTNGTFTWLFQFDLDANTLKTGGALPEADPTRGYAFLTEDIDGFDVSPITLDLPIDADGSFEVVEGQDLIVPIFLDAAATDKVFLPLSDVTVKGKLSSDHNCIGFYDAEALSPATNCQDQTPYKVGASLEGLITLDAADEIVIEALDQSLCVLLSGDSSTYGDGGSPNRCKRTGGTIDFKGDHCQATGQPGGCEDSMRLAADFAAQGVKVE
jgi:hypothetical protein